MDKVQQHSTSYYLPDFLRAQLTQVSLLSQIPGETCPDCQAIVTYGGMPISFLMGEKLNRSLQITLSLAHSFFPNVYKSTPHQFQMPSCMPAPPPLGLGKIMEMTLVTAEELSRVIRRLRSSSAPSPFIYHPEEMPSLQAALLNLFNRVIVPLAWK